MNLKNIINWKFVSNFGKNKVIKRTYIYLFIVPALAKLLSRIQNPLLLEVYGTKLEIPIELPFTWKYFFYSALFFTVATLIYYLTAPAIIKENDSFSDFLSQNKTPYHLSNYYENLDFDLDILKKANVSQYGSPDNSTFKKVILSEYFNSLKPKKSENLKKQLLPQLNIKYYLDKTESLNTIPTHVREGQYDAITSYTKSLELCFWEIYTYANRIKLVYIIICLLFFAFGFLLISYVLFESIQTVILLS